MLLCTDRLLPSPHIHMGKQALGCQEALRSQTAASPPKLLQFTYPNTAGPLFHRRQREHMFYWVCCWLKNQSHSQGQTGSTLPQGFLSPGGIRGWELAFMGFTVGALCLTFLLSLKSHRNYSWPLNNMSLNCMGPLICGFFSTKYILNLVESVDMEPWMVGQLWSYSQSSTAWRVGAPNTCIVQSQQYIPLSFSSLVIRTNRVTII